MALRVAGQTVVVTLGITIDGTKVPPGHMAGFDGKLSRVHRDVAGPSRAGLRVDESILCVVDGGKGIRKALVDVLGGSRGHPKVPDP